MNIEEFISMLFAIGNMATIVALLILVGVVIQMIRYAPWKLQKYLRQAAEIEVQEPDLEDEVSAETEPKEKTPPPYQPKVIVKLPETAMQQLEQIWGQPFHLSARWFIGGMEE